MGRALVIRTSLRIEVESSRGQSDIHNALLRFGVAQETDEPKGKARRDQSRGWSGQDAGMTPFLAFVEHDMALSRPFRSVIVVRPTHTIRPLHTGDEATQAMHLRCDTRYSKLFLIVLLIF
jgi:hypothetical protein